MTQFKLNSFFERFISHYKIQPHFIIHTS